MLSLSSLSLTIDVVTISNVSKLAVLLISLRVAQAWSVCVQELTLSARLQCLAALLAES